MAILSAYCVHRADSLLGQAEQRFVSSWGQVRELRADLESIEKYEALQAAYRAAELAHREGERRRLEQREAELQRGVEELEVKAAQLAGEERSLEFERTHPEIGFLARELARAARFCPIA